MTLIQPDIADNDGESGIIYIGESLQETVRDILRHGCWDWNPTYSKFDVTLGTLEENLKQLKNDLAAGAQNAPDADTETKFIEFLEYAKSGIEDCYAKITDYLEVYEQIMLDLGEIVEDGGFDENLIDKYKWGIEI